MIKKLNPDQAYVFQMIFNRINSYQSGKISFLSMDQVKQVKHFYTEPSFIVSGLRVKLH